MLEAPLRTATTIEISTGRGGVPNTGAETAQRSWNGCSCLQLGTLSPRWYALGTPERDAAEVLRVLRRRSIRVPGLGGRSPPARPRHRLRYRRERRLVPAARRRADRRRR